VESVAAQTLPAAELILVDDASADGTVNALQELANRLPSGNARVLLLDRNRGPSAARNAGWAVASQPYVAFLDADDAWHPQKLEQQMRYLEQHPEVGICGHRSSRGEQQAAVLPELGAPRAIRMSGRRILLSNPFITPSVIVRRDLPLRFSEERRYMEDHLLWMRASLRGERVMRLEEFLAFTFKAPYGEAGLSAQLRQMEIGELANYADLRREGLLSAPALWFLKVYSLAKFVRRVVSVSARKAWPRSRKFL
jgi:glycosyltransferase involved in cell wall biosynthesis